MESFFIKKNLGFPKILLSPDIFLLFPTTFSYNFNFFSWGSTVRTDKFDFSRFNFCWNARSVTRLCSVGPNTFGHFIRSFWPATVFFDEIIPVFLFFAFFRPFSALQLWIIEKDFKYIIGQKNRKLKFHRKKLVNLKVRKPLILAIKCTFLGQYGLKQPQLIVDTIHIHITIWRNNEFLIFKF